MVVLAFGAETLERRAFLVHYSTVLSAHLFGNRKPKQQKKWDFISLLLLSEAPCLENRQTQGGLWILKPPQDMRALEGAHAQPRGLLCCTFGSVQGRGVFCYKTNALREGIAACCSSQQQDVHGRPLGARQLTVSSLYFCESLEQPCLLMGFVAC